MGKLDEMFAQNAQKAKDNQGLQNQNNVPDNVGTEPTNVVEDFDFDKIPQDKLFSFIGNQRGRKIKSFDDLKQNNNEIEKEKQKLKQTNKEIVKEVHKYESPESEAYDKYFLETGRSIKDFVSLNKDWTQESDDVVVMEYLKQENPYLTPEDIRFQIEDSYKTLKPLDPDEFDADEVAKREREIKRKDIEWKQLVAKSKEYHESNKSKYLTPVESAMQKMQEQTKQGQEIWKDGVAKAQLNNIDINGFNYEVKDAEKYKETFGNINGIMNR